MPILGIIASQISGHLNTNSYESIATVTVGAGGSSSISFSSIPSTYKHLQVRGIARTSRASTQDALGMQFNSDTGSNYSRHQLNGDGTSATADAGTSTTSMQINRFTASSATANNFGVLVADILDYSNTNKYKTVRTLGGYDDNGSGFITLNSGLWMSTSAVSTITLISINAANFAQYSSFALYGIKG